MNLTYDKIETDHGPVWVRTNRPDAIEIVNIAIPEAGYLNTPGWEPFVERGTPYSIQGSLVRTPTSGWMLGPDTSIQREDGKKNPGQRYLYDATPAARGRIEAILIKWAGDWHGRSVERSRQMVEEWRRYMAGINHRNAQDALVRIKAEIERLQAEAIEQRRILRETEPYILAKGA